MRPRIVLAFVGLIALTTIFLTLPRRNAVSPTPIPSMDSGSEDRRDSDALAETSTVELRIPAGRGRKQPGQSSASAADALREATRPTAHLRVRVVREDNGAACEGALVYLSYLSSRDGRRPAPDASARTDPHGLASLDVYSDRYLELKVSLSSAENAALRIHYDDSKPEGKATVAPLRANETSDVEVVVELPHDVTYFGLLLDDDRLTPIAGATVFFRRGPNTTDSAGRFTIQYRRLRSEIVSPLWIQAAGYCARYHAPGAESDTAEKAERILMRRSATVTGLVLDAHDEPRRAATVRMSFDPTPTSLTNVHPGSATTGDDGRFELHDVPSGVPVSINASPGATTMKDLVLQPGEKRDVVLRTRVAVELSGQVFDPAGALVRGGEIHIDLPGMRDAVHVRSDGSYYIPFVYSGKGRIEVESSEDQADVPGWSLVDIEVPPGVAEWTIDLRLLPLGRIAGRLLDASGAPVRGGLVTASLEGARELQVATEADGSFVIPDARSGTWFLHGSTADSSARTAVVRVTPGMGDVELRLPATGSIRGRVTDPSGLVIGPLGVTLSRIGDDDRYGDVEPDGSFLVQLVPEGTWYVSSSSDGRTTPLISVVVHSGVETHVPDLVLEPCATLHIVAASAAQATVEVHRGSDLFVAQRLRPGGDNTLLVPLGDITVLVRDPSRADERHDMHVVEGVEGILTVLREPRVAPRCGAAAQCASSQFAPWPISTCSGTRRGTASTMQSCTSLRVASISDSGTSSRSSSCTCSSNRPCSFEPESAFSRSIIARLITSAAEPCTGVFTAAFSANERKRLSSLLISGNLRRRPRIVST
jgi:hypothetical protein